MTDPNSERTDEASRESFPASDPPAWTPISGVHVSAAGESHAEADVVHDAAEHRFQIEAPEGTGLLEYRMKDPRTIVLVHTEVAPALSGKGIASRLAHHALEYARAHQLQVIPVCPFVRAYLKRHPEYADILVT
jgi:predicted GNAT family acetyltransferase